MINRSDVLSGLMFFRYSLASHSQCATCHIKNNLTQTIKTQPMEVAG